VKAPSGLIGGQLPPPSSTISSQPLPATVSEELAQFLVVEPSFYLLDALVGVVLGIFGSAISGRSSSARRWPGP
jgi:hypothetical protein